MLRKRINNTAREEELRELCSWCFNWNIKLLFFINIYLYWKKVVKPRARYHLQISRSLPNIDCLLSTTVRGEKNYISTAFRSFEQWIILPITLSCPHRFTFIELHFSFAEKVNRSRKKRWNHDCDRDLVDDGVDPLSPRVLRLDTRQWVRPGAPILTVLTYRREIDRYGS